MFFFCQQLFHCFLVHFVGYTAVYRTYRSALGFFVKALALGALTGNNIIGVYCNRCIALIGIYYRSVHQGIRPFYACSISNSPLHTTFVNGIIGTLRFTGSAVNTFICYFNSHSLCFIGSDLLLPNKNNCSATIFPISKT